MTSQRELDIAANRATRKYSLRVQAARVMWGLGALAFRLSPRPLWAWRRLILRAFGARVGAEVHIYPSVRIIMPWNIEIGEMAAVGDRATLYALGPIRIGPRATISQNAHLCAGSHDITRLDRRLITPAIAVEADVWIAADAFIGPGVTVGAGAVVGARAVVMRDVASRTLIAGNPARLLRTLSDLRPDPQDARPNNE